MNKTVPIVLALAVGLALGISVGGRLMLPVEAQTARTTTSFSAVPSAIGAEDVSGPYEVVEGWPKDLSTLPGHEKWTYGGARGIFAESPNRVFLLGGGELPNIPRPQTKLLTDFGPNVQFPLAGLPWRNANTATPPGAGGCRQDPAKGMELWRGASPPYRELGVDARWEHCIIVVDAHGNIIEDGRSGTSCSSVRTPSTSARTTRRSAYGSSTITRMRSTSFRTTASNCCRRSERPTCPAPTRRISTGRRSSRGCPTGPSTSSDGYNGTRVAKFDKNGKFLFDFGQAGRRRGTETRPGYMNNVHGVAVDPQTRRVFVNDRDNHRIQSSTRTASTFREWKIAVSPSSLHFVQIGADRTHRRPSIAIRTRC